ncbi:MAG: hypothetical protein A3G08_03030 [Candidatus Magasanikbacteria bacterium RIFCSPLOWO2_12_FULL_47_9b]|nr:MAG: hypothetical protein A3I74_04200 [Candidatus Magasanikbacteria bacterium RIFCSPLOWO2_02_FULL_47_16]OGH79360.1 MAG: hypothetical protein A3C10_04740 [Candidatus Magasanikbacteria bacterium RIFCSPHIGHO2_02_FULL_48_18]OGH82893.1 MAG: hypothetical protein A3G08_03030 [Candidatus Magasanikbacteria bacterium RIFCSPLOWO2_12_FULL_47_9b]
MEEVDFPLAKKEIIIVDDGSTDGTLELLKQDIAQTHTVIPHIKNQGKGAAIRSGLRAAHGDFFIIQDADLEYNPKDIVPLLQVLLDGPHEIAFGSRALGMVDTKQYESSIFYLGGKLVTWWTNFLYKTHLTDQATCYKMFTKKVLESIHLTCAGFEFCAEFTGKALNAQYTIHEVPISYKPRGKKDGKKIKLKDSHTCPPFFLYIPHTALGSQYWGIVALGHATHRAFLQPFAVLLFYFLFTFRDQTKYLAIAFFDFGLVSALYPTQA